MKPLIFISSVSRELRTARQLVANTLHALGYEPVWQDIFETSPDDLREMLRKKIDSCSAVLQIVGHAYGAEPPTPDATFGRCSYTQYEALYARSRKKPVYYLIAENDLPRDATAETIDTVARTSSSVPPDSESPGDDNEIAAAQADATERQQLQSVYRQSVLTAEQVYYPVHNHQETELSVRRLRDDLAKLRRGFRTWMIGISAALVLIVAGVGLNQWSQRQADKQAAIVAQKAEEAAKKTAADLAEIKAKQEKERLAAEAARQQAQKNERTDQKFAERFLHQLLTDKEIKPEDARQRAIKELPDLVDLPLDEVLAIIDRKLPVSTPEAPVSPLERARTALAQGKYDDVFQAADAERAEGRELAMLEGTAALAKFRESPQPEWNERAAAAFNRAIALSEKGSTEWTAAAISSASVLDDLARYAEAEPLLIEAQRILEDKHGKESSEVTVVLNNLAQLLAATNRLGEAEPLMRRALAMDEQSFGTDHPRVAIDLNNLASLLQATNRLGEAEPLMRRALAIDEQSFGTDHPKIAIRLNNLALLLQATNRLGEAEPLMRRALAMDEQSFGTDHPRVAIDLNNLAQLLQATNRLGEAELLMRRALAIDEQSFGTDHPSVARDLNNLASLLQATNRLGEAEPLMRRALAMDEQSFGTDHPKIAIRLNNLAQLLKATNRLGEAEPLMQRALAIDEQSFGTDHPEVARDLNNLAQLLQATNRLGEAEPLMRRALAIDEQSFGNDHPMVAIRLNNLATLLADTNRLGEAEPLMRRALAIDEQSFGTDHPNVARDLNNLAQLLQATNRLGEAEPLMRRALAIFLQFTQKTGHPHPSVPKVLANYRNILSKMKLSDDEIAKKIADAEELKGPFEPIVPEVERLLGPAKPVAEVLAALDQQYKAEGKPAVYFLMADEPISPHLDELCRPNPEMLNASGIAAYRNGDHANAVVHYEESLKLLADKSETVAARFQTLMNRAAALRELGDVEQARDELRKLLAELKEDDKISALAKGRARYHLALCERRLDDRDAAQREAEESLKEYGDDEDSAGVKKQTEQLLADLKENKPLPPLAKLDAVAALEQARARFRARAELATLPLNQSALPLLDQMLGPAKSTQEVFEELDRQYREQNKPPVWFLPLSEPISPHLDELLGPVPAETAP